MIAGGRRRGAASRAASRAIRRRRVWLTAPTSGLVTAVKRAPAQPVDPDEALLEIIDLAEVHAIARVPEHLAGKLKPGQSRTSACRAGGGKHSTASCCASRRGGGQGRAARIDAIFTLPNPGAALRPGMRAEFSIVLGKREGVMSIPRVALQGDATSRTVYRKHYDTR